MAESRLYDDLVMDHIKNARNFRVLEPADRKASMELTVEQHAIVDTVRKFPARVRCAALPWATLDAALDGRQTAVLR